MLPDGPATLVRAPGAQESQDADTALFKAARWIGDGPVFVMGRAQPPQHFGQRGAVQRS